MSKYSRISRSVAVAACLTLGVSAVGAQVKGAAPAGALANEVGGSIPGGGTPFAPAAPGQQPLVQFCNPAAITINDNATASPYPSNITVAGMTGLVSRITVTLNGLSHTFPDDVDMLLVAPGGRQIVLMSDAGGSTDAVGLNLTFDDLVAPNLPDSTALATGSYKPTNYVNDNVYAAPAPAATIAQPYGASLGNFHGIDPNGTWNLYVRDGFAGDTGAISGGWCINVETTSGGGCGPTLLQGDLNTGDPTQTGRLVRNAVNTQCSAAKVCPGTNDAIVRHYDSYTLTNTGTSASCVQATLSSNCGTGMFLAAYSGSYNPAAMCTNYAADNGSSFNMGATFGLTGLPMGVSIPPGGTYVLVVHEIAANAGCAAYSLLVEQNACACSMTCPANVTTNNTPGVCGATVSYPVPASTGGCGTISCAPPSGTLFPAEVTTPVSCSGSTTTTTCGFTVRVEDVQPPVVTAPDLSVNNDPGLCSAVVAFTAPTSDNCAGVGAASCAPPSGSTFPVGANPVSCTATDAAGNVGNDGGTITVNDVEQPTITCPADIEEDLPPGSPGQNMLFPDPVVGDNCPGVGAPSCVPASGDFFPAGQTSVLCDVIDGAGNVNSCNFLITLGAVTVLEVPTASTLGLAALAILLAGAAFVLLRRVT